MAVEADGRHGRIVVQANWPPALLRQADEAAARFGASVRAAFDAAVLAAADCVSGVVAKPDPAVHRMPLCADAARFAVAARALIGLRPDQLEVLKQFQPFYVLPEAAGPLTLHLGHVMAQLAAMTDPTRARTRRRVAVWAHSADPDVEVDPPRQVLTMDVEDDGVLERKRTIATFELSAPGRTRPSANPNIAFDLIINDEPWPLDMDDHFGSRSAIAVAAASEFIRSLQRSAAPRPPLRLRQRPQPTPAAHRTDPTWLPLDLTHAPDAREAFDAPDVALATHTDDSGNLTILIKAKDGLFGRPIAPALALDPHMPQGLAAEEATLDAASTWGLPDFVFNPQQTEKGSGLRELGDGTIITGSRAVALQVKSRDRVTDNPVRERSWMAKKAIEGARQAAGSVRTLSTQPMALTNGRGRTVVCDGNAVSWVGVVVLDHSDPPEGVLPDLPATRLPTVAVLRRDWDFLFDHLRSVSAVVDYFHRVAHEAGQALGTEAVRYFELADADEQAAEQGPRPWAQTFGAKQVSHPLLPKRPVSSTDDTGHAVFRIILEDIAEGPFDHDEADRLRLLGLLDRLAVTERAELGRLLLDSLEEVAAADVGTRWRFRRVIQDEARLQLAFGVCTHFTETHRIAFSNWAMLRHTDFVDTRVGPDADAVWTVAVLLTPRFDGARPWDTSMNAMQGDLGLTADDLTAIRAQWKS
ncbi:hypothetical protein [Catellatospora chokoriensis]|uniref:Uncharacterized protein n=1 Tax=Catellatospora chokoriensis TaxID=310353 RepID=A0A8J3NUP3_9ACTN|nr:hypothetical protein [Catellatospora chokoriensis]GIF93088.1 hypothetical protein Cch02nite_65320 [Catellatospora chokoriensis]